MPLFRRAAPNEVLIVFGVGRPKALVTGTRTFLESLFSEARPLAFGLISVPVDSHSVETLDGAVSNISILLQAQIDYSDQEQILLAAALFLGKSNTELVEILRAAIDAQLRQSVLAMNSTELEDRRRLFEELHSGVAARLVNFGMVPYDFFINGVEITVQ